MAGVRVSRRRGLTFGDINISNTENNGVYLVRVEKPSSPTLGRVDVISPGRDGSTSIKNRFLDREISVTIGIYKEDIIERRDIQRTITRGLILSKDKLYFHDEPTKYYIAEVFDEVTEDEQDFFTELTFKFKCEPFIYDDESSASWTGIKAPTTKTIVNNGNFEAKPLITITGTATRVNITISEHSFALTNVTGTVYVDTDNMVVYNIVDGKKKSLLPNFSGLFPKIKVGNNLVTIGGEALNISLNINFKNTYVC